MYFIAIVLPKELDEKIHTSKIYMFEQYGCRVGLKSPAHITLIAPFWMEEEKETVLKQDITLLSSSESFHIQTRDFSAFKPRTIYIDLETNHKLIDIKKAADRIFQGNTEYKIAVEERPFRPHITIATRDLRKKDFAEAWSFFQFKEFREQFKAEGISLLRHNSRNWDVIFTSAFTEPAA